MNLLLLLILGTLEEKQQEIKILSVKPDASSVTIEIEIPKAWYISPASRVPKLGKEAQTVFSFEGAVIYGEIEEPEPKIAKIEDLEYDYLDGRVIWTIPIRYKPDIKKVKGVITYQICHKEKGCIPDKKATFEFDIPEKATSEAYPKDDLLSGGFLAFTLKCIGGGLAALVMPCSYPLLPLVIMFFMKQGQGRRVKTFGLALMYGLGIIVSFTCLGFILSIVIGRAGANQFAANPWVNLTLTLLFFYLALALFGLLPLQLPSFIMNRTSSAHKEGYIGAFALGLVFSLVAFTCVVPIAAALLSEAAAGNYMWSVYGMVIFSASIAAPFLVLGLFPGLLKKIPKSGEWMNVVKVVVAYIELALCVYYLAKADFSFGWGYLTREMVLILWLGILILISLYLFGLWNLIRGQGGLKIGPVRVLFALCFLVLSIGPVLGLSGHTLEGLEFLLPVRLKDPVSKEIDEFYQAFEKEKRTPNPRTLNEYEFWKYLYFNRHCETARVQKKPIFIEFTGFS